MVLVVFVAVEMLEENLNIQISLSLTIFMHTGINTSQGNGNFLKSKFEFLINFDEVHS